MNARPITIPEEIEAAVQSKADSGATFEELSQFMADLGLGKVEAIKLLRDTTKLDLAEAKEFIHYSQAWAFRRANDEAFHESLFAALEELKLLEEEPAARLAS
jgi:ribosomal protein L7/L12